jgi:Fur family ferric uptake transcriptional regulator
MKPQRNTRQRQMVAATVRTRRDHPSAEQVYQDVRGQDPKISLGTVYRNLNLLVDNNEVRHVKMLGVDRFDWRVEPHYHIVCRGCGDVSDAPIEYHSHIDRQLAEQTGYEISQHSVVFEGLCPDCQRER